MELFENIRREHFIHGKSIRAISRQFHVHRRTVRQAIDNPIPPKRRTSPRLRPVFTDQLRALVDQWLDQDSQSPRKQRHTAKRIFERLKTEHDFTGGESTVRQYVAKRRRELGLKLNAFIPLHHLPGDEAEVDWYEATVEFPTGPRKVFIFAMRACYSGREFHMAFPRATQQAFLQAHVAAFNYFGGTFKRIRYDNLKSAVKKVLKGRGRAQTDRFLAMRSHYLFESEFCLVGLQGAHEKGGVEGGLGRFRRQHLVPVPKAKDFKDLNRQLLDACASDDLRTISGRKCSILQSWEQEKSELLSLPATDFDVAEVKTLRVDRQGRISVKSNRYSVPITLVGQKVEARLNAYSLEAFHSGRRVACHERLQGQGEECLELDHYLELLRHKPSALKASRPLKQAKQTGQWPAVYEALWSELKAKHGETQGTRELLEVLFLNREFEADQVHTAVALALEYGTCDSAAVKSILRQLLSSDCPRPCLEGLGDLEKYDRPKGDLSLYDQLLRSGIRIVQCLSPLALTLGGLQ